MKFLIQVVNGEIQFDFQWELIQAIKGTNWFRNEVIYEYVLSDVDLPNCIPIGSVEFTLNYMEKYYNKVIKPLHIPPILFQEKYLKRKCEILHSSQFEVMEPIFVKSVDKIKGFTEIVEKGDKIPEGNYFISEVIDIESEWRCFVYNEKLVGLQNYSGDFTLFPDVKLIEEIIYNYKEAPRAYTLDIGINENGIFVIELHNFMSVGFYGFSDHKLIPLMFKSWVRECLNGI